MGLSLVTAPTSEPLTLAEAAAHLRISDSPIPDADYVSALITAARNYAEGDTRRAFVSQTWDYTLKEFPSWGLYLPIQPVQSVTYVQYVKPDGTTASFIDTSVSPNTAKFDVVTDGPRAYLIPKYGLEWPETRDHGQAVTVRFVAGYSTVPEDLKHALKMLIADWYEGREASSVGQAVTQVPFAVDAILSGYRMRGF